MDDQRTSSALELEDAGSARGTAPLVTGFALLIAIVLATAWLVVAQQLSDETLRRLVETRGALADLLSTAQDAETGQRGYMLTGDTRYLAPYEAATAHVGSQSKRLETLLVDDPDRKGDLTDLARALEAKFAELNETIALRRADRVDEALSRVRADTGRVLMDRVRQVHGKVDGVVYRRILELRRQTAYATTAVEIAIAFAALLLVILGIYASTDARRRNQRLARAYEDVRLANEKLLLANANRDRLEAQLRQSQKMEAMGQLTGGLAHDFNNMLAIILGNLNLMKRRIERGDTRIERFADQAIEGASRAANLTHRLLAFARNQPLSPEPIVANRLVGGMSEILRRTLGETIRIETVQAAGLWTTRADPHQLESALLNLAINARDAMPEGGRLTIETGNAYVDEGYASDNLGIAPGQYVMLAVTDTGTGMEPEVAAKAFEPFFTTKAVGEGTGLGLSQVFGFVRQSDGYVKIYSELGRGTTVKIYLPRLTGAVQEPGRTASDPPGLPTGHASEIILVVEDEAAVRRLTVEALRDLKYTVIHAEGGARALALLDAHPDVALLFTDVMMPDMNGKQLADAASARHPGLKVLYTTGYTRNAIVHNGVVDTDVNLLGKPFTLEQLAQKVRQTIAI